LGKAFAYRPRRRHAVPPARNPREELYDLRADPYYMNNLADDPGYSDIKKPLREKLMEVLTEQRDPRVAEAPCRYERAPYAGELQDFQKDEFIRFS